MAASQTAAAYLAPDMIAFIRGTALMAQHLDLKRGGLAGDPIRLADPVASNGINFGGFSVSADGRVAYRAGGAGLRQLKWYDRSGKALAWPGSPTRARCSILSCHLTALR